MEDFLAKFYLAIVFGVLLVSALFLGYQIQLTQQLENNLDKFRTKKTSEKPTIILANTIKGKGVKVMENNPEWHHKSPNKDELNKMIKELS